MLERFSVDYGKKSKLSFTKNVYRDKVPGMQCVEFVPVCAVCPVYYVFV